MADLSRAPEGPIHASAEIRRILRTSSVYLGLAPLGEREVRETPRLEMGSRLRPCAQGQLKEVGHV